MPPDGCGKCVGDHAVRPAVPNGEEREPRAVVWTHCLAQGRQYSCPDSAREALLPIGD